jgi:hypothetical protein
MGGARSCRQARGSTSASRIRTFGETVRPGSRIAAIGQWIVDAAHTAAVELDTHLSYPREASASGRRFTPSAWLLTGAAPSSLDHRPAVEDQMDESRLMEFLHRFVVDFGATGAAETPFNLVFEARP